MPIKKYNPTSPGRRAGSVLDYKAEITKSKPEKSLTVGKSYGFEPVIHTPRLLDEVRADWRAATPFVEWVCDHAGED